jgi:hypothetical protein
LVPIFSQVRSKLLKVTIFFCIFLVVLSIKSCLFKLAFEKVVLSSLCVSSLCFTKFIARRHWVFLFVLLTMVNRSSIFALLKFLPFTKTYGVCHFIINISSTCFRNLKLTMLFVFTLIPPCFQSPTFLLIVWSQFIGVWPLPHFVICFLETKNAEDNLQTFNSMFNVPKVLLETPPSKFKLHGVFYLKQIEYVKFMF